MEISSIKKRIIEDLLKVRKERPLVHNITNYVVMNNTANALLALGASPIMSHAQEEIEELISISSSLVINIGTLDPNWIQSMKLAANLAREKKIPLILDPVGAGATKLRTDTAKRIIELSKENLIIKGNASEILALTDKDINTKGVDSSNTVEDALIAAQELSSEYNAVVIISGNIDIICGKNKVYKVSNGSPLMSYVTGMGCTASCIVAAFCGINNDFLQASVSAMSTFAVAGEIAAERSEGPGTFQVNLYDVLYNLNEKQVSEKLDIQEG